MASPRSQFIELIEQGAIPVEKIGDALKAAKITPDARAWRTFIDHLLLWLGGLALAFALMFFVAYNWNDIGRFAKFGAVEGLVVLAIVAYCRFAEHAVAGKVSLLVATICLGVLLALFGQTYQTGADPWQLFFTWAMLMLPWAIIGRFPAIWILWVALINTSIVLYYQTFRGIFGFMYDDETGMLWLLFIFNTLLLVAWEFLAAKVWQWLAERWAPRLLAIGSGVPLTWLVLHSIFTHGETSFLPGLAWVAWLTVMYFIYRRVRPDLFMLAGCCLSVITVSISFFGEHLLQRNSAGGFLFLSLLVIGMGAGSAFWLKTVHQELQS
ncbi:MAG: DUF2157 domain-containing protein [Desulfobulbaceae bacterium]|nr:DUF2157 domain-containing protein [Desulfobulbaceae bacterium]